MKRKLVSLGATVSNYIKRLVMRFEYWNQLAESGRYRWQVNRLKAKLEEAEALEKFHTEWAKELHEKYFSA